MVVTTIGFKTHKARNKKPTMDDLIEWWLWRYHGLTIEELKKIHTLKELSTPDWYKKYPVTEKQHDKWEAWAEKKLIRTGVIRKGQSWSLIYLDAAPHIKKK